MLATVYRVHMRASHRAGRTIVCAVVLYCIPSVMSASTVHYTYYYPYYFVVRVSAIKFKITTRLNRAGMLGGRAGRAEGFDTLRPLSSPIHFVQSPEYLTTSPTSRLDSAEPKALEPSSGPAARAAGRCAETARLCLLIHRQPLALAPRRVRLK